MTPKISVVIPTWNGRRTVVTCIKSLQNQTQPPSQIVVVDNASTDGTPALVSPLKVKLVRLDQNTGVVGGRNSGLAATNKSADYVLFFDHDMIASQNMLSEMLKITRSQNAGIITPKIYYLRPKNVIWSAGTDINLLTGQVIFRNGPDTGRYDAPQPVGVAPAAILVKRRILDKIGGFDPVYASAWEDADFCYRAKAAGFATWYAPSAIAYHDLSFNPAAEAHRLLTRYPFAIGRNRVIFMKRFGRSFPVFLLFLPIYIVYYFFLGLKHHRLDGWIRFLHGTLAGLVQSAHV